jgi:hypothetical protein
VEPSIKYSYIRHVDIIELSLFTNVGLYYIETICLYLLEGLDRLGP